MSISTTMMQKSEVGELRPSQVLLTYGIGSLVDLPNLSVIVMGLEDWPIAHSTEIGEERLLRSVQRILGTQVTRLLTPPKAPDSVGQSNWFDESHQIGVPVAPFPRWLVCTRCRLLAPIGSGLFEAKVFPYRPHKASYVHNCTTQGRAPMAVPARFLVACSQGHLDDFPWVQFVHRAATDCQGPLYMYELGASGEAADVVVECKKCNVSRRMAEAFGRDNRSQMPPCRGRRPHLRDHDPDPCAEPNVVPILQGASNSWFPVPLSALALPPHTADRLTQLVEDHWTVLEKASAPEVVAAFRAIGQLKEFSKFTDAEIWQGIQKKREGVDDEEASPTDLKGPEWQVFSNPTSVQPSRDFRLRVVDVPTSYAQFFDKIVLAEKLREVRALIGFTRIESPRDFDSPFDLPKDRRAALSRRDPTWIPASETRGEGIFFQFSEQAIQDWLGRTKPLAGELFKAHRQWREPKGLDPNTGFPGLRFVLLHSFAHALIRQLSIECGYTTASIAERIYSGDPTDGEPMAGVLIYTSAPDSEGTLGGLCALGTPEKLERHLDQALETAKLCASDPLCSEHRPVNDGTLHAAACHACSFLPETSCERGNKYLDRAVLVKTVEETQFAFFEP